MRIHRRLVLDLDGVLVDTHAEWMAWLHVNMLTDDAPFDHGWLYGGPKWWREHQDELLCSGHETGYDNFMHMIGSDEVPYAKALPHFALLHAARRWLSYAKRREIITAREPHFGKVTEDWLGRHLQCVPPVHYTKEKAQKILEIVTRTAKQSAEFDRYEIIFIEDSWANAVSVARAWHQYREHYYLANGDDPLGADRLDRVAVLPICVKRPWFKVPALEQAAYAVELDCLSRYGVGKVLYLEESEIAAAIERVVKTDEQRTATALHGEPRPAVDRPFFYHLLLLASQAALRMKTAMQQDGAARYDIGPRFGMVQRQIGDWRRAKGFETSLDNVPEKLMLLVTEAAEVMEAFRKTRPEEPTSQAHRDALALMGEELADIVIRTMDLADALGCDLREEIRAKMLKNEARPHKHGKRC